MTVNMTSGCEKESISRLRDAIQWGRQNKVSAARMVEHFGITKVDIAALLDVVERYDAALRDAIRLRLEDYAALHPEEVAKQSHPTPEERSLSESRRNQT